MFKPSLYVQLSPQRITVRNVKTGESFSDLPELAIDRSQKPKVVGIGAEARSRAAGLHTSVINPFAHPRTLVGDFTMGVNLLKGIFLRVRKPSLLTIDPFVVMHPLGDPEGGFTEIEIRTLLEMALGAGASEVKVWQGRQLTDQEVLSRQFPADGRVLS
jgi:rod shape-determining protein MreB